MSMRRADERASLDYPMFSAQCQAENLVTGISIYAFESKTSNERFLGTYGNRQKMETKTLAQEFHAHEM